MKRLSIAVCAILLQTMLGYANPGEDLFAKYLSNVEQVRELTIEATVDVQRMYMRQLNEEDKEEFQRIYGLAVEDPVYAENSMLYFKGLANFDWSLSSDSSRMTGTQKLKNAYATIMDWDPIVNKGKEKLRELQALSDSSSRFTIPAYNSASELKLSPIIIPSNLASLHHLYSIWYPSPSDIGMPTSLELMEVKGGPYDPLAYFYTPSQLDPALLSYLARVSNKPNLRADDLNAVITIDRASAVCVYFAIMLNVDGESKTLLSITNVSSSNANPGLALPSKSILTTTKAAESDEGTVWSTEYYFQMRVMKLITK